MERGREANSGEAKIRRLEVEELASLEIEQAALYYQMQREDLDEEFLDEVERTMKLVVRNPYAYPVAGGDTRRASLNRFPYMLLYRVEDEVIWVIGCVHGKRDPSYWLPRT